MLQGADKFTLKCLKFYSLASPLKLISAVGYLGTKLHRTSTDNYTCLTFCKLYKNNIPLVYTEKV